MLLDIDLPSNRVRICWLPTSRRGERDAARAALALAGGETGTIARSPRGRASITHSGGVAAAATAAAEPGLLGVGIDYEPHRPIRRSVARFYLSPGELWGCGHLEANLLRLWTVKEALFKATPGNDDVALIDLRLASPESIAGEARCVTKPSFRYTYRTIDLGHGLLSVATCGREGPRAWL